VMLSPTHATLIGFDSGVLVVGIFSILAPSFR
jgi:hypothetical protein